MLTATEAPITHQSQLDHFRAMDLLINTNKTVMINEYLKCIDELKLKNSKPNYWGDVIGKFQDDTIMILDYKYENENEVQKLTSNEINSFAILNYSFKKELKRFKNSSFLAEYEVERAFSNMRRNLSQLPIEYCAVEINPDKTIKITMSFLDDKLLMITKSLNGDTEEVYNNDEVMYSYFINRKLIASDVTNFQYFVEGFKEYISE